MTDYAHTSPLTQRELLDGYFMEYRNHLLALAAFLDRLDRAAEIDATDDDRLVALRQAVGELPNPEFGRVHAIQTILSDRDTTLLDERDTQSAFGAPGAAPTDGGER